MTKPIESILECDAQSVEDNGEAASEPAENIHVRQLCERLDIRALADTAIRLVKEKLQPERIQLEAAIDPNGDQEWLVIRADVRGNVDEVLRRYASCKREWLSRAPLAKVGLVRFLYNIL